MKRLSSCSCALAALVALGCLPSNTYTESQPDAQAVDAEDDEDVDSETDDGDEDAERDEDPAGPAPEPTGDETAAPGTTNAPTKPTTTTPATSTTPPPALPTGGEDDTSGDTDPAPSSSVDEPNAGAGGANDDGPGDDEPTDVDPPVQNTDDETQDSGAAPDETEPPVANDGEYFGDSRCSDEFVFCEDFESGELDSDAWEAQGPAPDIDDGLAARGSRSAHFHTEDNGLSLIRTYAVFPMPNNRYYARAFVYFDSMPTAPEWAHWSISGAEGTGTEAEIRVGGQYDNEINRFGVGSDRGPTGDWTNLDQDPDGEPQAVPTGQWVCLEWMNDGENQESRFWWDDQEHPSLFTSASEHGGSDDEYLLPEFESMWFGWWLYQPGTDPGEFDVWIDEIVIDDEPVGCTR